MAQQAQGTQSFGPLWRRALSSGIILPPLVPYLQRRPNKDLSKTKTSCFLSSFWPTSPNILMCVRLFISLDARAGHRAPLIPTEFYDSVQGNFTNSTLFRGTNDTFTRFAVKDPETTYNTFLSVFGVEYVPGYSEQGARLFDLIQGGIQLELGQYPDVEFTPLPPVSS